MKPSLLFILFALFLACSPNKMVEVKDETGQVIEQYEISKNNGKKNGEYRKLLRNQVIEIAQYQNDTLHGIRSIFDPEGIKEIEENYILGIHQGSYLSYYANGQVKLEGEYRNGVMSGIWKKYYESGKLMETVSMSDNEENGPFTEFWENGNLKAEGSYLDGDNENGELKLYDEQGILEKTMQCERGICHTTWKREANQNQ